MINKVKIIFSLALLVSIASCKERIARLPVNVSSGVDYTSSIELAKKINQKEEIRFREYLKAKNEKFDRSNFGFLYKIGNNLDSLIKSGDIVKYSYIVESLGGSVIYSKRNRSLIIDHQEEIKGMHEGLKLMSEGSKATFIFPSHQAYGFHGDENKIKSNTPLIYRVEVLEVNNKQSLSKE